MTRPAHGDDLVLLWSAGQVERGAVPDPYYRPLTEILRWSKEFLVSSHPELGRPGPVCPYTQPSLRKDLFYLAATTAEGTARCAEGISRLRVWHQALSAGLTPSDRELLTILVVLPDVDPTDSTQLDELQRNAKDEFVADGLMIGQFHPTCDEPGLWNRDFRPLRSPIPLLAIRAMLVFDLPFLVDQPHVDAYLKRFAQEIPTRIREQLVARVANTTRAA